MKFLIKLYRDFRILVFYSFINVYKKIPYSLIEKIRESIYLKSLLDDNKITIVIDVGANEGQFASDIRNIGFKGRIISFEPVSEAFIILKEKCSKDKFWECYKLGLGNEDGFLTMNVSEDTKLSSFLDSNDIKSKNIETVEIKRLDSIINDLINPIENELIFLKMDTQGYDINVFQGSQNLIPYISILMSEISVQPLYNGNIDYKIALSEYEKYGFKLYNLSIVAKSVSKDIVELNCLMTK